MHVTSMTTLRILGSLTLMAMLAACSADRQGTPEAGAPPETATSTRAEDVTPISADVPPDATTLTADGWGPLRIGMSLDEVTAAAGADANPNAVGGPDPGQCDEFRPANAPDGVLVMVENGVLTRISVSRNANIRTPEGIGIGDPESKVLAAYGSRARVDLHKYVGPPGKYITVWSESQAGADARGIRYEIGSDGKVAHLRGGGPSIEYVEGCS